MKARPILKLLRAADYRHIAWKNGGGTTAEIALAPRGDAFAWRLSLATVASSGPFSSFPEIERIIVLISGPRIELDHGAQGRHLLEPLNPHRFDGSWTTHATLCDEGVCQDFNVMVHNSYGRGKVDVVRLEAGKSWPIDPALSSRYLYLVSGKAALASATLERQEFLAGDTLEALAGSEGQLWAIEAVTLLVATISVHPA